MSRFLRSLSLFTLEGLPDWSAGPKGPLAEQLQVVAAAGYNHIELVRPGGADACRDAGLSFSRSVRINTPDDADPILAMASDEGCTFASVHLGWGMESDRQAHELIEATLFAAERRKIPAYVELHRATILQDARRTVDFIQAFPELLLTADFSHWYTGHEMVYGGFERKLAFIQPIFERVRHVHGRFADPGCIQVTVTDEQAPHVQHFLELWRQCFDAFLTTRPNGEAITFTAELLQSSCHYARTRKTEYGWEEESDRWQEALRCCKLAEIAFIDAKNPF